MSTATTTVTGIHHVGVQTADVANALAWYRAFIGAEPAWSLDTFSELTHSRLPGITRLVEIRVGTLRLHLFHRPGRPPIPPTESLVQFQHVCLAVSTPADLEVLRERWERLYDSGEFTFALNERSTPIVVDAEGVHSFYAYDVNGLELEFTCVPGDS
ncbi:VOC family protein [Amycolatopsis azurea]|uniref:VOC family protein n=1 Tax=Amycolatopsis azurea TaxID=36819 RepID=UPI00382138F1